MKLWAYRPNSFLFASGMVEWTDEWESDVDGDGSPSGPYVLISELGFTREDVAMLDDIDLYGDDARDPRYKAIDSLRARIEALLPPEAK